MDINDAIMAIKLNYPPQNYTELREGLDLAIELLEKEIPLKPIDVERNGLLQRSGWKYRCPKCKCGVGVNNRAIEYTQEDEYCPSCGQRLDWD